ncbi:hypothetical protein [Psychrobacter sp. P11G5]|uniref:hypothetical protein n=1 Tax=Psychrobacter sp. P11G5 TaxID=1699624 RepID=UPI00078E9AFB|nr:hypothetical protein [Psychrobacter sp. P11G5]AMN68011.1 hypothetical protein AK825_10105 [Psychrobacter sp. P11G5]
MKDDKKPDKKESSADNVDEYLQTLDNKEEKREQIYYSQEQSFNSDELARVINKKRLNELLAQSDDFLRGLSGEIEDFDEDSSK